MFRDFLVGLLALLAIGTFSTFASAQVAGDLKFDIWMWPQTTASETSAFDIDFETLFNLNVGLSGLIFSSHTAFGVAGIEHHIADLQVTLGPLNLKDEFAFAVPYIECPSYAPGIFKTIDFFAAYGGFNRCRPIGDVLFVKKRVKADISLTGFTFSTLVILEDVNFPSPTAKTTDVLPANPTYIYDSNYQTQAFRFGGIIELSGTTVSGIKMTSKTGICADWDITIFTGFWGKYFNMKGLEWGPAKYIKKYAWFEEVCISPKLEFTKEYIAIEGLSIFESLTLNSYLLFKPDFSQGFESYVNFNLSLFNVGRLNGFLRFTSPGSIQLEPAYWNIPGLGSPFVELYLLNNNLTFIWEDVNADLAVDKADMITISLRHPTQGVRSLFMAQFMPKSGIVRMLAEADIVIFHPSPLGKLEITALWERGSWPTWSGDLKLSRIDFKLKENIDEHYEFGIDVLFDAEAGLSAANAWIYLSF